MLTVYRTNGRPVLYEDTVELGLDGWVHSWDIGGDPNPPEADELLYERMMDHINRIFAESLRCYADSERISRIIWQLADAYNGVRGLPGVKLPREIGAYVNGQALQVIFR